MSINLKSLTFKANFPSELVLMEKKSVMLLKSNRRVLHDAILMSMYYIEPESSYSVLLCISSYSMAESKESVTLVGFELNSSLSNTCALSIELIGFNISCWVVAYSS